MPEPRPSFDEFTAQLEQLFGRTLAPQAREAAKDFWDSWPSYQSEIAKRGLAVHVEAFRLALIFPEYKRYHVWKGAGIVLSILGLAVVWFEWRIGVMFLAAGAIAFVTGNRHRFNDGKQFAENLMKEATLRPNSGGFAGLCFNYIAGTIRLVTARGAAQWPQHPSNALTGATTRVSM